MTVPILQPAAYAPSVTLPAPYEPGIPFPLSLAPSPATSAGTSSTAEPTTTTTTTAAAAAAAATATSSTPSVGALVSEIARLRASGELRALLDRHGAIYFQNLGLRSADEFSRFAHAFGWSPHEDIGNPVRRTVHAPNVATANEGPNTQPVYPHNEFGLSPHYPAYVFFYCASAPETGGETPINNSAVLYERLVKEHPEFIKELREKGVKYQLFYPNGPKDQTASAGTTVRQSYGLHILDSDDTETARKKVEDEVRRLPTATLEWENQSEENPLGDLRVWQVLPAVRDHPRTGQTAFFNNIVSRFLNALKAGTLEPPHLNADGQYQPPAFYGDGTLIPKEYLEAAVRIVYETRALVSWTPGDVVLLDNHVVQHAREPWTGNRKLLASLWDETNVVA